MPDKPKSAVKRYDWEDALIEAQTMGVINNTDLMAGLKLAHAINWVPKGGGESALKWKNDTAFEVVGLGRATFYRAKGLKDCGYLVEQRGNLHPVIPESHRNTREAFEARRNGIKDRKESLDETEESLDETEESLDETEESLGDNPYSVNIYSVDEFNGDSLSEDAYTFAGAHGATTSNSLHLEEGPDSPSHEPPINESIIDTAFEGDFIEPNMGDASTEKFRESLGETLIPTKGRDDPLDVAKDIQAQQTSPKKPVEAPVTNEQPKGEESPIDEMPEPQKPVEPSARMVDNLTAGDADPVEPEGKSFKEHDVAGELLLLAKICNNGDLIENRYRAILKAAIGMRGNDVRDVAYRATCAVAEANDLETPSQRPVVDVSPLSGW